jgi:hypothetical protein
LCFCCGKSFEISAGTLKQPAPDGVNASHLTNVKSEALTPTEGLANTKRSKGSASISHVVVVDSAHPYHRVINLDELQPLLMQHPGHYRAKLLYNSEGEAKDDRGEWAGSFEGADFGIEARRGD